VKDTIKAEAGNPALTQLMSAWRQVNAAADVAIKIQKLIDAGQKAWAFVEKLV
jgi:hypothetical protein